jgi:hypothetical protein
LPQKSDYPLTYEANGIFASKSILTELVDDKEGIFKEKPLHDWTSHAADVHRYAAAAGDRMKNQTFSAPATTGLVKPFYPGLGV